MLAPDGVYAGAGTRGVASERINLKNSRGTARAALFNKSDAGDCHLIRESDRHLFGTICQHRCANDYHFLSSSFWSAQKYDNIVTAIIMAIIIPP